MASQKGETAEDWERKYVSGDKPWDLGEPEVELALYLDSGLLKAGANVLELGCGTGTDSVYLARRGFHVVGIDFSPTAIQQAKDRAHRENLEGRCEFYPTDACDLSFLKSKFDFAYDKTCFDNLDQSKRVDYLRSVRTALLPSAKLLLIVMDQPEKGLSEKELRSLLANDFRVVSISKSTLRHVGHEHQAWRMLLEMRRE